MVLKMMNIANKDLPRLIAALFHIEVLRLAQNISLFGLSSFELPSDMFDEKSTSPANHPFLILEGPTVCSTSLY